MPPAGDPVICPAKGRDWRNRYDRILSLLETPSMSAGLSWCNENDAAFAAVRGVDGRRANGLVTLAGGATSGTRLDYRSVSLTSD